MDINFKGTKGKWYAVEYAGYYIIQNGNYYGDKDVLDPENFAEEQVKANALLISKAPEMLEMLQKISAELEHIWMNNDSNEIFDVIDAEELDNLIKSATEI